MYLKKFACFKTSESPCLKVPLLNSKRGVFASVLMLCIIGYIAMSTGTLEYFSLRAYSLYANSGTLVVSGAPEGLNVWNSTNTTGAKTNQTIYNMALLDEAVLLPKLNESHALRFSSDGFVPVFQAFSASQILIYSVWYDHRVPKEVLVVSVAQMVNLPTIDQLRCVYYRLEATESNNTDASKLNFSSLLTFEKPLMSYNITDGPHQGALTIICEAAENMTDYDWWLSIVPTNKKSYMQNFKPIIKVKIKNNRPRFGMCAQPLFGSITKLDLVQMIEFNRILGASYFYFYIHDVSPEVQQTLLYYTTHTDYVEVLPWYFDAKSLDVRIVGQHAALADCQRRLIQNFEYMVYTDLDEFIILQAYKNWHEFVENFAVQYPAYQYVFNNVYYVRNKQKSKTETETLLGLSSLLYTERYLEHLPNFARVKVIAVSDCIFYQDIHYVRVFLPTEACSKSKTLEVDARVGFLHHYRHATANLPDDKRLIEDHYVFNTYKDILLSNVRRILTALQNFTMPQPTTPTKPTSATPTSPTALIVPKL